MRCAVYGCNSDNQSKKNPCDGVKFFHFPKDKVMCKKWVHATKRKDKFNVKTACICSKHFLKSDFKVNLQHELLNYCPKNYRGLKDDTVPSQDLPCTSTKTSEGCSGNASINKGKRKQRNGDLLNM